MAEMNTPFKDFLLNLEAQIDGVIIFEIIFKFRPGVIAFFSLRGLDAPF